MRWQKGGSVGYTCKRHRAFNALRLEGCRMGYGVFLESVSAFLCEAYGMGRVHGVCPTLVFPPTIHNTARLDAGKAMKKCLKAEWMQ